MKITNNFEGCSHTFVICAYQESKYLEMCICSLLGQSVQSSLCIATSTPNEYIRNMAAKYQLPLFINSGEKGIAADWNFAWSCAGTPLVTLAHQDDIYCRDYTESILDALNKCAHPLIAFTDYCELRDGRTVKSNRLLRIKRILLFPLRIEYLWRSKFVRRRILSLGSAICCPSVTMVKPNLPFPVFKNNMKSNVDWQAWAELSGLEGEFAYIPRIGMKHRIHEGSATSDLLKKNERRQEDIMVYRMFWPEWAARLLERFYQISEKSNQINKG